MAASVQGQVMTLNECMRYAISKSTKIRIRQAAIDDARIARRDAALALFTPAVNANTNADYSFGRSIDPQTNTYFNTTSFHNSYGISASYVLFDGLQAVNNYKISKTGMQIADSQEKQAEADICLAVMEAYYNVVYYQRLGDVYRQQLIAAEQALEKAKRQEQLGQKGHADVVQMEADLADRQYDLISVENLSRDRMMTLQDLMFWPMETELVVDTAMPVWQTETLQTNSVVDFALEHDPSVRIASWNQLNAKRELSTAKWQLLPTLGLYAGWNTSFFQSKGREEVPFVDQFRNNGGEYVQLSLSIPIWGRLGKWSKITRKKNALDVATAEYNQKCREVESEVRRAVQDRDGSITAYRQAQHKAEVQAEAYHLNLKKLEQGLISPLEFQTANNNYLRAQADEMNSLFLLLIKQAVVRYYAGTEYVSQ